MNRESLNVVLDENVPSPSYVQPMMYQPQIPVSHLTPQYPLQQIPHSQHTHQMQQAIQIFHSQHTHQIQPNYQTVPQTRQPFRQIGNVSQVENSSLDVDEDNVFTMNMNLMPFFKKSFKGKFLSNKIEELQRNGGELSHDLTCKTVNFAMELLQKKNNGKLNFKSDKVEILHIVAQSLVLTFPIFKTEIREGENSLWEHVSIHLFN